MQTTDRTAGGRARAIRNALVAQTYVRSLSLSTDKSRNQSVHLRAVAGSPDYVALPTMDGIPVDVSGCCGSLCETVGAGTMFVGGFQFGPPPPYDASYNSFYDISWTPFAGATAYMVTTDFSGESLFVSTGETQGTFYTYDVSYNNFYITITATNDCGESADASGQAAPCFLAGSLVTLADGTSKPIEEIRVGDWLLGAFGEHNQVLALHRPVLGSALMCRINDEHSTTAHHPHIGANKKIYCYDPVTVRTQTYGRDHEVINAAGESVTMFLHGLHPDRIQTMYVGADLKTVDGSRIVRSIEPYGMSAETQLYNLVTGGSHTYHVDGYAVTGWPREDDWDYDAWAPRDI
jgi:hypothetical protein